MSEFLCDVLAEIQSSQIKLCPFSFLVDSISHGRHMASAFLPDDNNGFLGRAHLSYLAARFWHHATTL